MIKHAHLFKRFTVAKEVVLVKM